jgi:hypothetical protein
MINEVRTAVLAILNKNNYGYITPNDFNLYARMAQMDIFEDYFQTYNDQVYRQNYGNLSAAKTKISGEGYANLRQITEEVIDTFSTSSSLTYSGATFSVPADCYMIMNVLWNSKVIDRVSLSKVNQLVASNLTAPSTLFPAYVMSGTGTGSTIAQRVTVYPSSIISGVSAQYIRIPTNPNWGYVSLTTSEPVYNPGASTDFELPESDFSDLVARILQYAGVSIREAEVVQVATAKEAADFQKDRG